MSSCLPCQLHGRTRALLYLTRQVFAFACHLWRTFLPACVPVTIPYSDLIAKALGNLSLLDKWAPNTMLGHRKKKNTVVPVSKTDGGLARMPRSGSLLFTSAIRAVRS